MRFDQLLDRAGHLPVIESSTLLALGVSRETLSVQLCRWVGAGKLVKLRRGLYLLPRRQGGGMVPATYLANLIVRPSYVSLEHALALHGLIPETVPVVQSVTTSRPGRWETSAGTFSFRHVSPRLFFGYKETSVAGGRALVAAPEKALLDVIHLSRGLATEAWLDELRLQGLEILEPEVLRSMARRAGSPRLVRAAESLCRHLDGKIRSLVSL